MGQICAASSVHKTGKKAVGVEFFKWQNEDVAPGSHELHARLQAMDDMGVYAQILYGNVLGFGGQRSFLVDPELRRVSIEIYNDAMAEMQKDSGGRIFPMAVLPWWDIKLAVAEAKRCAKMGLKGINTNSDPHERGLPDLGTEYWYPLWELASDLNLPINFHIGGSDEAMSWLSRGAWPSHSPDAALAYGSVMLFVGNQRVMANLLISRVLERFPRLKIVSVESGVSWIPFVLEAVDYQMRECGIASDLSAWDIFRRQIYACSWFERKNYAASVRRIGVDNVMFETDYPHPTCLYPDPLPYVQDAINDLTWDERQKVFSHNAKNVYNIAL
jgi:predicted TIM-barrel fold metal-dependent hydrolase